MAHDARAVANFFIRRGYETGNPLDPLQIIKLVYIAHGWMLGLYHRPLIRQPAEAWRYGPVVRDVYRALREYGGNKVTKCIHGKQAKFDDDEEDLLSQVHDEYGSLSGVKLSGLTHKVESPWHDVWNFVGDGAKIPNNLIEKYYEKLSNDYDS